MSSKHRPYRQGDLDSLCGIYAVINGIKFAVRQHQKLTEAHALSLFEALIRRSTREGGNPTAVIDGLGWTAVWDLARYAKKHIHQSHGIALNVRRPFRTDNIGELHTLISHLKCYLYSTEGAVICPFHGRDVHWTVVTRITQATLIVSDSGRNRRYSLKHCAIEGTVDKEQERLRVLEPKGMILVFPAG